MSLIEVPHECRSELLTVCQEGDLYGRVARRLQQAIVASSTPGEEFQQLSPRRRREVFFQQPETVRASLVADMDRDQLQRFVRRIDPDEVADVLGFFIFLGLVQWGL